MKRLVLAGRVKRLVLVLCCFARIFCRSPRAGLMRQRACHSEGLFCCLITRIICGVDIVFMITRIICWVDIVFSVRGMFLIIAVVVSSR